MAKKRPSNNRASSRNNRALYLPMPRAQADEITLQCRLALQAVRLDQAGVAAAHAMAETVLLCGYLAEAGYSSLDIELLGRAEHEVNVVIERGHTTGDWTFPDELKDALLQVVNEYDHILHSVRLVAIIDATDRLGGLIRRVSNPARVR